MPQTNLNHNDSLSTVDKVDSKTIGHVVDQLSSHIATHGWHHPDISPILWQIGPLQFRWYSLAYLMGIILGWIYIRYMNRKFANNYLPEKALENLPVWIVISVILGGRIGYVLFYNFNYYLNNLADIGKIWQGGMSFHGGLAGVIIGSYIFSKLYKLEFFRLTDFLAVVTPIGLFFGRCANFINKELWGKLTNVSWGVIYPKETFARHPSQLYEAALEGLLLFIILNVAVKYGALKKKAILSGMFLMFYGLFRAICEVFREPDKQIGYVFWKLSMGQILCIPMILAGVIILIYGMKNRDLQG